MKKIILTLLTIITLLYSCSSDDSELIPNINNSDGLIQVKQIYGNSEITGTTNFISNDKLKTYFYKDNLINNVQYDYEGKMTKHTTYAANEEIEKEYSFTYDTNGNITSVHDFFATPLNTYEPINQDRTVIWNGNKMTIPLLVDDVNNKYDVYEFTFNDDNLLSKHKITKANGTIRVNVDFTYDSNKNPIHVTGFYNISSQISIDIETTYDDKINPYFPHINKYYINNLIIYGCRTKNGYAISPLLSTYFNFGKNNPLLLDSANSNTSYITYSYDGDKPIKSYFYNMYGLATTSHFLYR